MKYRKKTEVVEALQFKYDSKGVEELRAFCGDSLGDVSKDRTPYSAAKAYIDMVNCFEGDWVTKGDDGILRVLPDTNFRKCFEKTETSVNEEAEMKDKLLILYMKYRKEIETEGKRQFELREEIEKIEKTIWQ